MGHMVEYGIFTDDERRAGEVAAWADECYADGHDWQEDPSGEFPDRIEFSPRPPFETESDAREWLEETGRNGFYYSGGVRFVDPSGIPATKKVEAARDRAARLRREVAETEAHPHFEGRAAALIGCRTCGSKIARDYLKGNRCPACRADMRPKSVLDALAAKRARLAEAEKAEREAERDFARSVAKKAPVKWLVRIEYHC